jgi:hypothetical protein
MQAASTKHVCSFDMFLPGPNLGGPSLINTPVSSKIEQQDILMFGCLGKNAKLGNRPTFLGGCLTCTGHTFSPRKKLNKHVRM